MLENATAPITGDQIEERLGGYTRRGGSGVVRIYIHRLRAKLGRDAIGNRGRKNDCGYFITELGRQRLAALAPPGP